MTSVSRGGLLVAVAVAAVFLVEFRTLLGLAGVAVDAPTYAAFVAVALALLVVALVAGPLDGDGAADAPDR